jgi:hypothetical protein
MLICRAVLAALLGALPMACLVADDLSEEHDFAFVVDDALDFADVSLAEALAVPDDRVRNARLVAGLLDPYRLVYEADLWNGHTLLHATIGLDGELLDIDAFGPSHGAALAAEQLENAGVTLYDAIAIAEDRIDDGRAFQVSLDDGWLHVDVLGTLGVYGVWLAPDDGDIVSLVLENDLGPPDHCPHVC